MKAKQTGYRHELEVERLWVTTGLGLSIFLMLPFNLLIVVGLWDKANQAYLIIWLIFSAATYVFRWYVLHYYHLRKQLLAKNLTRYKTLILLAVGLTSISWVVCLLLFLDMSNPANVLMVTLPPLVQVVGSMMTWFAYYPAVLVLSIPPSVCVAWQFLSHGGKDYALVSLFFLVLPVLSYYFVKRISDMLTYALNLSFENKALQKESEEKSALLETALENMGQAISMSDKQDRLRMWNGQFLRFVGNVGGTVSVDANLAGILQSVDPPVILEANGRVEYRNHDGLTYEIRQSGLRQGGRVVTYTDITDLIKREQALEKARREAVQANAAKTRFLAAASHDLRQPIHALGLFFAELSDRVLNPETEVLIAQVEDSIEAVNSMLKALLDVSKLDAGIVQPDVGVCSLDEILFRLNAEFQPLARENHNRLKIRPSQAAITTDPVMLERMLRNLIGNALRHTETGRVLVGVRKRSDRLEIQILDTGRGIPEDQFEEIFVEFHQLHNPQRDRRQGLGLGLAIVKRLANLLGHPIKVASKLERGACFSISVPLAKEPSQLVQPALPAYLAVNQSLAGCKLLVLDDDIAVREGMGGLLTLWGCEVVCAASPEEATMRLAEMADKLDLLIVDYRLPDNVSGIDVARSLLAGLGYPAGVLVITGDTGPERLQEAESSGFPLLHKPVQPAKLRSTLQHLIGRLDKIYH